MATASPSPHPILDSEVLFEFDHLNDDSLSTNNTESANQQEIEQAIPPNEIELLVAKLVAEKKRQNEEKVAAVRDRYSEPLQNQEKVDYFRGLGFNDGESEGSPAESTPSYPEAEKKPLPPLPSTPINLDDLIPLRDPLIDLDSPVNRPIQATKDIFTDTQKVAYVGLCSVSSLELVHELGGHDDVYARMSADNWQRKFMRGLYKHMDINEEEQRMIESLAKHGVLPSDLVESFISQGTTTTLNGVHTLPDQTSSATTDTVTTISSTSSTTSTVEEVKPLATELPSSSPSRSLPSSRNSDESTVDNSRPTSTSSDGHILATTSVQLETSSTVLLNEPASTPTLSDNVSESERPHLEHTISTVSTETNQSTASLASTLSMSTVPSTSSNLAAGPASSLPELQELIIDLRWTVLLDLLLLSLEHQTYDARSRVLVRRMAGHLGLEWKEVIVFEHRVTEQLQLSMDDWEDSLSVMDIDGTESSMPGNAREMNHRNKQQKKKRYLMMGLATIGGGIVLGLSAGLMAPVIGAGIGAAFTTIGVSGTASFLGGGGGLALITSGAVLSGSVSGARRMARRTKGVDIFDFLTVHDEGRVNAIISVTGWLSKPDKAVCPYAFSTISPLMGDHYSIFWEPEMLTELGSAFKILATEVVGQAVQQALHHTMLGILMTGLAWPLALLKLGYIIDNPWANALDRARIAGLILADTLMNRNVGSRPVTLIGFSLGARVIFYCLLELARVQAFGIVENAFLFGTPVTANKKDWQQCTTVISGRFVNGYVRSDWMLAFLFRATSGGLFTVAGLRPIPDEVRRLENMDCTDLVRGHLHYRNAMPRLLKRCGFEVTSEDLPKLEEDEKRSFSSFVGLRGSSSMSIDERRRTSNGSNGSTRSDKIPGNVSDKSPGNVGGQDQEITTDPATPVVYGAKYELDLDSIAAGLESSPTAVKKLASALRSSPFSFLDEATITAMKMPEDNEIMSRQSSTSESLSCDDETLESNHTPPPVLTALSSTSFSSSNKPIITALSSSSFSVPSQPSPPASFSWIKNPFGRSTPSASSPTSSSAPSHSPPVPKSTFFSRSPQPTSEKKKQQLALEDTKAQLAEVGIEIKEIKSTLPKMVVNKEAVVEKPKVDLAMPGRARLGY